MLSFKINDIKITMAHLLLKETFDEFFLEDSKVVTFATFEINGKRNLNWYDDDEKENQLSALLYWREARGFLFDYIKGKKTPEYMKFSLKASREAAEKILEGSGVLSRYLSEQPDMYLQIKYEKGELTMVTGITHREFTMDKTLDRGWDDAVREWIKTLKISVDA
ncbi:hypothetical protein KQI69_08790 [Eubacterium sp. MSJ-13]|uniref:DUF5721 family protein n=1 Tax=Eubacterium sp. MSJ-13 TaxID=2841513 RepID=UPI001C0FAD61|nr:DUF5721 family protein [Eubacterium sp. MSJ-13]MBU5479299.1 hypothetical protein [Eubacterium sp. MSJ-13]